jgi:hypothetical protein
MKKLLFIAAAIVLSGNWSALHSAQLIPMSVEDLTREATYVIEGQVLSVNSSWNADRTQIYTYVSIAVSRSIKQDFPLPILEMRLLGGEIPGEDIGMEVYELPKFVPATNVVLFLGQNPQSLTPVISGTQGAFVVTADPATGQLAAIPQEGQVVPKSEFDRRIQQALGR